MLRKNKPPEETLVVEPFQTLIGPATTLEGRVDFSDSIRVDGRVVGDIQAERGAVGCIAVGPEAEVRGNITAHRVLVAGTVIGNIRALEIAHLLGTARVTGDIAYARLSMCAGAQVNGKLADLTRTEEAVDRPGKLLRLAEKAHDGPSAAP
jgi:cytoskeletal protein CcmA (bactofilin family)